MKTRAQSKKPTSTISSSAAPGLPLPAPAPAPSLPPPQPGPPSPGSTALYFWRETHPETGYLSQWFAHPFRDPAEVADMGGRGTVYRTAEHYMMYHKALLFGDGAIAARVLAAAHPRAAKALGRRVRGFDGARWAAERLRIVEAGNYAKFTCPVVSGRAPRSSSSSSSSSSLCTRLLATGDREIVEASPYDRIWGIGFAEAHAEALRDEWGLNLLGKALVAVRERLRREDEERRALAALKEQGEEETGLVEGEGCW